MNKKNIPPFISEKTITRRTLLDWMGKAAVLALGAELLNGCSDINESNFNEEGGPYVGSGVNCENGADFNFSPGEGDQEIFEQWKENTVDHQNLLDILNNWELQVDGLVKNPSVFSFTDLLQLERQDQITDFHCVEGWSVLGVPWNGLHLSSLFDIVAPESEVTHVTFHTQGDIYSESLPIEVALESKTMMAYGIGCSTIPLKHGFPLRLVVPRMLGYKSAKYVYRIELDDKAVAGYWQRWGYPYDAPVPEGRLRPGMY